MAQTLAEILVEHKIISPKTLERALVRQQTEGKQLEDVLLGMGVLTRQELETALRKREPSLSLHQDKKMLGDLLVEADIVSRHTIGRALERQKAEGGQLGIILTRMGVISEFELVEALGKQLGCKTIRHFSMHAFEPELLALLSTEFVMKHQVFPLRRQDVLLAVAISDPHDREKLSKIRSVTGLQLMPVLAPGSEISNAIIRHYLNTRINPAPGDAILVVDGSATIATVVQRALVKEGFLVITSTDGIDAVKLVMTQRPRLVITETLLPGLDGFSLLQTIKTIPLIAETPVIVLTSLASAEDEQAAFNAGFFDFIAKPVQPMRVVLRVKHALEITGSCH